MLVIYSWVAHITTLPTVGWHPACWVPLIRLWLLTLGLWWALLWNEMPENGWHLYSSGSRENLLTFKKSSWRGGTFKFYKMVKFSLVPLKSISKGQINKSTPKLDMTKTPKTDAEKKRGGWGLGVGEKGPQHNIGSDPFPVVGPGAHLIRWREIVKLDLATYTERPSARPLAWGKLRKLRNCGGKGTWQANFLWLHPGLISFQCSVCVWMETSQHWEARGEEIKNICTKKEEGGEEEEKKKTKKPVLFSYIFFFRRGSHHFVPWALNHPSSPVYHISHLLQNSLNIKRPALSVLLS